MGTAAAARARHRRGRCACGAVLPSHRAACFACVPRKRMPPVELECPSCGGRFLRYPSTLRARERFRAEMGRATGGLPFYCSMSCRSHAQVGAGRAAPLVRRRAGWSDETLEWERRLVRLGLGMDRGRTNWLDYGHDPNYDWRDD